MLCSFTFVVVVVYLINFIPGYDQINTCQQPCINPFPIRSTAFLGMPGVTFPEHRGILLAAYNPVQEGCILYIIHVYNKHPLPSRHTFLQNAQTWTEPMSNNEPVGWLVCSIDKNTYLVYTYVHVHNKDYIASLALMGNWWICDCLPNKKETKATPSILSSQKCHRVKWTYNIFS